MRSLLMESSLHLAWQHWTALGVAGTVSAPDHAVDLEALICFTPLLGNEDPRLRDESLDWCVHHSRRLVSISRLRHLRSKLSEGARDAFDEFAATVNHTAKLKNAWPTQRAGSSARTSGKSQAPDILQPALIQLRLRALFGVTARAELMLQFLRAVMARDTLPSMSASALTDIGYSKPALTDVLSDLATVGVLKKWRRGNRDHYTLARVDVLDGVISEHLPAEAPNWALRLRIAADLLISESAVSGKKAVVQAVALTKTLQRLHDQLERASLKPPTQLDWSSLGSWAADTLLAGSTHPESRAASGKHQKLS